MALAADVRFEPAPKSGLQWLQKYPPVAAFGIACLLALFVLPSALNLPQANPTTTPEFAPVPQDDDAPPNTSGNLASLGLGRSSTFGAGEGGPGGGAGPLDPAQDLGEDPGSGDTPTSKRCVGRPPRQTEDPLSPPCVAHFDGDNFGATYQGVTADEIRLLYYIDGGITYYTERGGEERPVDRYFDLDTPADPGTQEHFVLEGLRLYARYFNERYQTYKRRVHFYVYFSRGPSAGNPESRRSDAAANFERVKPFAVLTYADLGNEDAYVEAMAQRGVMSFGGAVARDAAFFQKFPRLLWSYAPSVQQQARQFSSYVCTKVVGHSVSFTGIEGDMGKERRLGLLGTSDPGRPANQLFTSMVKTQVEECGGTFVAQEAYPKAGWYWLDPDPSPEAQTTVANFIDKRVTTVIWAHGYTNDVAKAAGARRWFPEWIYAGDGQGDGNAPAKEQNQDVWAHAWTVSNTPLMRAIEDDPCYMALEEADPSGSAYEYTCGSFPSVYQSLRQFFTAVQVAGPRLGPTSIDKGFHAIPRVASSDPRVPGCFYEPNDYTCVKDAIAEWWDPNGDDPNDDALPGCYRMVEGAKRYIAGTWPEGDVTAQRRPGTDACNGFSGLATGGSRRQ